MERDLLVVLPEAAAHRAELRLWPFDLPFPYRISPWHEQVGAHSRGWVRETGLAPDDAALRRHDRYDMALFACLSYPDADRDGLDLVADWVSWWSIWNDFPDDPDFIGTPGRAEAFFASLTAVLDSPASRPGDPQSDAPQSGGTWPDPHTRAFADIWRRWCEGMSPAFTARTRENWKHWFAAYLTRCEQRREHALLDVDEYLALREVTGAARLEMDAAERCGRYEVPDEVLGSRLLRRMRHLTAQVINITQDVQSLAKEEAAGDRHNLVIVLEQRHGATREQALTRIHSMTREHTDAFLRAEAELPRLLDHLGIAVEQRAPVHRHVADLRSLMRGCFDFCAASGRYR